MAVVKPDDFKKGKKKLVEKALKDLAPSVREQVREYLESIGEPKLGIASKKKSFKQLR